MCVCVRVCGRGRVCVTDDDWSGVQMWACARGHKSAMLTLNQWNPVALLSLANTYTQPPPRDRITSTPPPHRRRDVTPTRSRDAAAVPRAPAAADQLAPPRCSATALTLLDHTTDFTHQHQVAPYLHYCLTDSDDILHGDADWPPARERPLKFRIFENPRWRSPPC